VYVAESTSDAHDQGSPVLGCQLLMGAEGEGGVGAATQQVRQPVIWAGLLWQLALLLVSCHAPTVVGRLPTTAMGSGSAI